MNTPAHPQKSLSHGHDSSRRTLIDKIVRWAVSAGGITVLAAVILIFVYLIWTVAPAFAPASITPNIQLATQAKTARLVDFSENGDVVFRIAADGIVEFYDNRNGAPLAAYDLGVKVASAKRIYPSLNIYGILDDTNRLWLIHTDYQVSFSAGQRSIQPRLEPAFSQQPIALGPTEIFDAHLANDTLVLVSGQANALSLLRFENVELGFPLLNPSEARFESKVAIKQAILGPRNNWVYLQNTENSLDVVDIRDFRQLRELLHTQLVSPQRKITAAAPLLGRQSLMIADNKGILTQWTVLRDDLGFRLQPIRSFDLGSAAHTLLAEPRRKGLFAATNDGAFYLIYPAAESILTRLQTNYDKAVELAIAPRADQLAMVAGDSRIELFSLNNPHPELSMHSLWSQVWYEGYSKPVYSWQSSSADNDFEPKFSLIPLVFGTVKAAFYALLFALPLAIMSAIYTAYFMSPAARAWVKPGIEVMAALPTVILGFIGGLWLAPIIESELSSVLTVFVLLPGSLVAIAIGWSLLPAAYRTQWGNRYAFIVMPIILAVIFLSFQLGPIFENAFFGGDSRTWLREVAGLDYAQRNALVVGMVMGLAVIPPIFSIAEDAIHGVPAHLINGSLALGATPWQTLTRVVLLTAGPGIFSAVMVGVGRAVGETMIVLMATGNTPIMDFNIFEGMRTFAANIAVELPETDVDSSHYRILFLTALVLFVITFFFNTLAEIVRERLRSHYGNL